MQNSSPPNPAPRAPLSRRELRAQLRTSDIEAVSDVVAGAAVSAAVPEIAEDSWLSAPTRRQRREVEMAAIHAVAEAESTLVIDEPIAAISPAEPLVPSIAPAEAAPIADSFVTTLVVPEKTVTELVPHEPASTELVAFEGGSIDELIAPHRAPDVVVDLTAPVTSISPLRRAAAAVRRSKRPAAPAAPRPVRQHGRVLPVAAMLAAGALLVGMTVPAVALESSNELAAEAAAVGESAETKPAETQSATGQTGAATETESVATRDEYSAGLTDVVKGSPYETATSGFETFIPVTSAVAWPFATGADTPISSHYGYRPEMHWGTDFNPPAGTDIGVIADGVVSHVGWTNDGAGYNVMVAHVIDGVRYDSWYLHMIDNSSPLAVGDAVKLGDKVGQVGTTGNSTGPHLHLEIITGGKSIDPYPWLIEHTGGAN